MEYLDIRAFFGFSRLFSRTNPHPVPFLNYSENSHPILKEYSRAYNRLKGRKSRGAISTDKWNRQVAMIQDWRDAALKGELSDAEFKQRLDEI